MWIRTSSLAADYVGKSGEEVHVKVFHGLKAGLLGSIKATWLVVGHENEPDRADLVALDAKGMAQHHYDGHDDVGVRMSAVIGVRVTALTPRSAGSSF